MNNEQFSYNANLRRLELDGKALFEGKLIEICVFGHWIPGTVALDSCGWYLMTLDLVGIRLLEGLTARRPQQSLICCQYL
jgi:hypothetical protein